MGVRDVVILEDDEAQAGLSANILTHCIKRNYQSTVMGGAPSRTHIKPLKSLLISGAFLYLNFEHRAASELCQTLCP
jgi:hypothetical protein